MQKFASSIARLSRKLFLQLFFSQDDLREKRDRNFKQWRIFLRELPIFLLFYLVSFVLLFPFIDRSASITSLPIILYATWKFDCFVGIITAIILIPIGLFSIYIVGGEEHFSLISTPFWLGHFGMIIFSYFFGQARLLQKHLRQELDKTQALQQKLQQEKDNAEIANRAKDTLLMSISHDLRTPMSAIAQTAQLLRYDGDRDRHLALIDNIETATNQLLQVVNDLLSLYRSNISAVAEVTEPFQLRKAIADVDRLMQPLFAAKGLTLSDRIAANIPDELSGYPKLLRQVLFNLLGNSLKYTDRGGVKIEITLQKQEEETVNLLFSLHDSGRGMPRELIPSILDESYRFSRLESQGEGYGLGLGNCQRMVATMGGTLQIESAEGKGTTILLDLCFGKVHHTEIFSPRRSRSDFVPRPLANSNKVRVLLVEDDAVNLATVMEMLQVLNCQVTATTNGLEALVKSRKEAFALAIVDMQLPDLSGVEIVQDLQKRADKVPYTVLLTANILLASLKDSLHSPIDLILTKPIRFEELQRILDRLTFPDEPRSQISPICLDEDFLSQETEILGIEMMRELWGTFCETVFPSLDDCLRAYATEEYRQCALHAHRLSSAAANMGLVALVRIAKEVEKVCDRGDRLQLYDLLKDLVRECDRGNEELARFLRDRIS